MTKKKYQKSCTLKKLAITLQRRKLGLCRCVDLPFRQWYSCSSSWRVVDI